MGTLCLFLILKAFSFSPLSMILAVGLLYMAFIMLRCVLSVPILSFYHKLVFNLVKCFSASTNHMGFILQFVNVAYHIDFVDVETSLHPWNKFHLIMVYVFLMYWWNWFANILLKIFASILISTCLVFAIRVALAGKMSLEVLLPLLFFCRVWGLVLILL